MLNTDPREFPKVVFVAAAILTALVAIAWLFVPFWLGQNGWLTPVQWFLSPALALLACLVSFLFYKFDQYQRGAAVFSAGLVLAVVSLLVWPAAQFSQREVYWLVVVAALTGLLTTPQVTALIAGLAIISTVGAAVSLNGLSWPTLQPLLMPLAMTGDMAVISWLSAARLAKAWQQTRESEELAQHRLRELVRCQSEAQQVYSQLKTTRVNLLEAEQTAQKATELKTRFISHLSHELRTPLTAIINFSYILSQTPASDTTEEQRQDYLTRIYQSGELMRDIANDLLDLAKIEAGQMELFWEPLDLAPLCAGVMKTVAGLIEDRPIELRQEIPDDLPQINADKVRIQQILLNLLGNAAKYTNEGHITLRVTQDDGKLKVSIIDTGIGIKKQDFERIFEEFQQTEEAFALRKPGAGLGLPISKKFVELHGGELWVESEPGQGSAFYFTLPITPPSTEVETVS
jgi:signal transduction histidine kinase